MGILGLILMGTALALKSTSDVAAAGATQNEMERAGQSALNLMALELRDSAARVVTVSADGSSIQFQVPVDMDGNGTVLDRDGAVEYGFSDNGTSTKGTITYRFVQNMAQGVPEVIAEPPSFARGYVLRVTKPAAGPEGVGAVLTGRWIVQPAGAWGGDIDGDGTADPIFRLDATSNRVQIDLWAMQLDGRGTAQRGHRTTNVCLRNK